MSLMLRPRLSHHTINNVVSLDATPARGVNRSRRGVPLHGGHLLHMHRFEVEFSCREAQTKVKHSDFEAAEQSGGQTGYYITAKLRGLTQ